MITKRIETAINAQINNEFYASYLYLSMSANCERMNLAGFAHWCRLQHQEEWAHAMKLVEFLNDNGGALRLKAIKQPPQTFRTPLAIFEHGLAHEIDVTQRIYSLHQLAVKEKSFATQVMLQWFISEQVEEEKSGRQVVEQLKMIEESKAALLVLDRELAARTNIE